MTRKEYTFDAGYQPQVRAYRGTQQIMRDVIIALLPAVVIGVWQFGVSSLIPVCTSILACVFFEWAYRKLLHKTGSIDDLSAVVTGMLLAFNVPVGMPIWELLVGDIAAIILVKMLFGGLGCNFMNPALVGRIVIMFSFTTDMTTYAVPRIANAIVSGGADAVSTATPLTMMDQIGWADFPKLLLGAHGGVIGEVCAAALIVGGIYLIVRKVIKPIIPLCYLGSLLLFSWLFGGAQPVLSLFAGGVMLGAIFMATDYVTSPFTNKGKVIFGIGCGLITAAIRVFGNYAEGVTFAILLMNILVPYINDLTMTKPLGGAVEK